MSAGARPTIRLSLACDSACIFCSQAGLASPSHGGADTLGRRITSLRERGHDAVTLVGGEPLLADDLEEVVDRIAKAGFVEIGLQTNGGRLAGTGGLAKRLVEAGLSDIHFSIHGARPEVHDHHTAREGSFGRVGRAILHARAAGLAIVASTVLTRSNQAVVGELPGLLASWAVSAWQIALPVATGRAEESAARVLPRLSLALPYALHAMDRAEKAGITVFITGAPLCLLGPLGDRALPTPLGSFAEICGECPARGVCPGVDPIYLARIGAAELRPRAAPPARGDRRWAALFVGTGERAPRRKADPKRGSLPLAR